MTFTNTDLRAAADPGTIERCPSPIEALKVARDALQGVQWSTYDSRDMGASCPACGRGYFRGHSPDCIIGRALALLARVVGEE